MRALLAAVVLLLSAQMASAGERAAFFRQLHRLPVSASLQAFLYLECTEPAAKDAASRDNVSPAQIMADWAASEAAVQCTSEGKALSAAAGPKRAATLKAMVRRINIEQALAVRRQDPVMVCAVPGVWRARRSGCSMQ